VIRPRCRHDNPVGQKFCGECGRPLTPGQSPLAPRFPSSDAYAPRLLAERILGSKAAFEGEREQVTVLFADLKGSMELLSDRDPEEARKLLDPVVERMMEAVHRYEGTVHQVMGDGIMALFGAPLAHEDHAVPACYAALRMQDAIGRSATDLRRSHGVEVQIRVNSADVVVRTIAIPPPDRQACYGPEVYRLEGELALEAGGPAADAEGSFESARALARERGARSLERRATTSLARLWRRLGRREDARRALAAVYREFTEGFDTADLTAARRLLDELGESAPGPRP
jgi:hypothetical protein